jgi:Helix-turn-helix domain of transposase family ISL3
MVPWARPRFDFTLLFEALLMAMVKEMPVAAIAKLVGEYDKKIWRVVHHYVDAAVDAQDLSAMEELGIDDTSFRRGQSYVSVFADLDLSERRSRWDGMPRFLQSWVSEGTVNGLPQPPVSPRWLRISTVWS